MKKINCILIGLLFTSLLLSQEVEKKDLKYKPKNLDEAIFQLDKLFNDSTKYKISHLDENEYIGESHFSTGMWIRNNWGLWKGGELSKYFNDLGIFHPDDMSGIILRSFYRHLKNQDYELDKQIQYYQDYWKKAQEHEYKMKNDTAYAKEYERESKLAYINSFDEKKEILKPGTKVRGWVDYSIGAISGGRTQIEGEIIEWSDIKAKVRIDKFLDEKKRNRVIRYNKLTNNEIWIHALLLEKI